MIRPPRVLAALAGAAALLGFASPATAAGLSASVSAARGGVAVRSAPTSTAAKVTTLGNRAKISPWCQERGQRVRGRVRTTDRWNKLGEGRYVSDAYVRRNRGIPLCPPPPPPPPPAAPAPAAPAPAAPAAKPVLPPITGGTPVGTWVTPVSGRTTSAYRTTARPEHDGADIPMPRDTPIYATAAGTVVRVVCNTSGPSCDVDGDSSTRGCGWYVEIRHALDVVTRYCHLIRRPVVNVDQQVWAGQIIGYVGTSGHSSGPHLHFEVHAGYPATRANAVDPIEFMRRARAPIA